MGGASKTGRASRKQLRVAENDHGERTSREAKTKSKRRRSGSNSRDDEGGEVAGSEAHLRRTQRHNDYAHA